MSELLPSATNPTDAPGPLAGVRVLELANLNAAPALGAILGDLGADVVKVEPPEGDQFRILSERGGNRPSGWTLVTRNKRLIRLDWKQPDGLDLLHRLTALADVLVLNQPPRLLETMGCTYAEVAARNPGAVFVHLSGFGPDGPHVDRPSNGTVSEAFGGLTHHLKSPDGGAWLSPVLFGDSIAALVGAVGTIAALHARPSRGGAGQFVDVAMYEAILPVLAMNLVSWTPETDASGRPPERQGGGLRAVLPTRDGHWLVVTAYSDAQVTRLLQTVGVAAPDDPAAMRAAVADWLGATDHDDAVATLDAARVQVTTVNDFTRLLADPQVRHRGSIVEVDDPVLGTIRVPRPTPALGDTPGSIRRIGPLPIGADNDEVYGGWLGLDAAARGRLEDAGVI